MNNLGFAMNDGIIEDEKNELLGSVDELLGSMGMSLVLTCRKERLFSRKIGFKTFKGI